MENTTLIFLVGIVFFLVISYFVIFKGKKSENEMPEPSRDVFDESRIESKKIIVPLKIQACERLLLYIERIQFPVLIKRVFVPSMTRDDFQFSLLQNVQDEFEHNLAQRLYVTEETWRLIVLSKEEVLQNINEVFNNNPDANVTAIAQQLVSFDNTMVEKAVINIKREFNSL